MRDAFILCEVSRVLATKLTLSGLVCSMPIRDELQTITQSNAELCMSDSMPEHSPIRVSASLGGATHTRLSYKSPCAPKTNGYTERTSFAQMIHSPSSRLYIRKGVISE